MMLTEGRARLARRLMDIGAVQFGAFRLKLHETQPDAPLSPFFLNLRTKENKKQGPLTTIDISHIALEFLLSLTGKAVCYAYISGIPQAGQPFADAFARFASPDPAERLIHLVKTDEDGHRWISGLAEPKRKYPQAHVLLIDDVATHAGTKIEAISILRATGMLVEDVLVVVNREQGAEEQLKNVGCRLHAIFTVTELLDFYVSEGRLSPEKRDAVLAYLDANKVA